MSHILLVEDNQGQADMIIHVLSASGYEVKHALRGLDGAKMARTDRPDLILMDFNLPDIDGRTLAMLLKKTARRCRCSTYCGLYCTGKRQRKTYR